MMVRISDLKTAGQVEEEARVDPEVRRELDRTALANAVAIWVIRYRADHDLSQTQLGRKLGMHQSAVARLEAGDHEPSLSTLARLARELGIGFDIRITPEAVELSPSTSEQPETDAAVAADFWRVTMAQAAAANMAARRTCRAVLALHIQRLSQSRPVSEKQGELITSELLREQLTSLREQEEADRRFLAELEQLLQDEDADRIGKLHEIAAQAKACDPQ